MRGLWPRAEGQAGFVFRILGLMFWCVGVRTRILGLHALGFRVWCVGLLHLVLEEFFHGFGDERPP